MTYQDRCDRCGARLDGASVAFVCSYDCTFCGRCVPGPDAACPNCGGELVRRPRRSGRPPSPPAATRDAAPPLPVTVARATVADADAIAPLFDAYRIFYREPSDPAGSRAFLAARLERGESVVFVARADGRAVGFTQLYPSFSSTGLRPLWILNDLFVVPELRGRGVASELLARAQAWGRETGAEAVLLETAVDNPAQHLYEARGWVRDRQFLHYEWRTG